MRTFLITAVVALMAVSASAQSNRYGASAVGFAPGNVEIAAAVVWDQPTQEEARTAALRQCQHKFSCEIRGIWQGVGCGFVSTGEVWENGQRTNFAWGQNNTPEGALVECSKHAKFCKPPIGGCNGPSTVGQR